MWKQIISYITGWFSFFQNSGDVPVTPTPTPLIQKPLNEDIKLVKKAKRKKQVFTNEEPVIKKLKKQVKK